MLLLKLFQADVRKKSHRGNTLAEYGIIGVLGAVAVIVGLQAMSGNLNDMFALFQNGINSTAQNASNANAAQAAQASGFSAIPSSQIVVSPQPAAVPVLPVPAVVPTSNVTAAGQACTSTGQCIQTPLTEYSPTQTSGANGISLVDSYANLITQIATLAHDDPQVDPSFAAMIDDIAEDAHGMADDERATLEFSPGESFNFSIQSRYQATLDRAMNYLQAHPNVLSPEMTQLLVTASNNVTQQGIDFLNGADPSSVNISTINQKFTDAGGTQGATYVDQQAGVICGTGGVACATTP